MSAKSEEVVDVHDEVCASCGIAAVDDVTLKDCDGGCDLVKYCSDGCQSNHRDQHEQECNKRKAEIHDKQLFEQPNCSHWGECSICCLPLPLQPNKSILMRCCCKIICKGCDYAHQKREIEQGLENVCALCQEPLPESKEEGEKKRMEGIKKNDPVAMCQMGEKCRREGDYESALKYLTKAADLGDAVAHFCLSRLYLKGEGVDKDGKKYIYHWEEAAIAGHPLARYNLGCLEKRNGRFERAKKHFIIAANLGHDNSLKGLRDLYAEGHATKEEYAGALRAYQAAVEATKSAERKVAEAYYSSRRR